MKRTDRLRKKLNNGGFSLVELLVAVAILSVIVVPIMRSFTTSAITASKAQSLQNATSVAEKVMEEVKTLPGEKIRGDMSSGYIKSFAAATPVKLDESGNELHDSEGNAITYNVYRHRYTQTATSGEIFDVYAEVSDMGYEEDDGKTDVSDINSTELPELYQVDSEKHFVISWEVNNYDSSAVENLAYKANASKANVRTGTKTTTITLTGGGGSDMGSLNEVVAKCDVKYEYNGTSLEYSVFTKYAKDIAMDSGKMGNGGPNLYLFYTPGKQINSADYFENEKIIITDDTVTPLVADKEFRQDLYVILQNFSPTDNKPAIILKGSKINPPSGSDLTVTANGTEVPATVSGHNDWVINEAEDSYLYTNLPSADSIDASLYKAEKKERIYATKVMVYKQGTYEDSGWPAEGDGKRKLAELNSTMRVR